jgi:hypothetical protein
MEAEIKTPTVLDAVERLSADQCLDLLASRDLGRVALVIGDQP